MTEAVTPTCTRPCEFDGCDLVHFSKGHCRAHYEQMRRTGILKPITEYATETGTCGADDCDNLFQQRSRGTKRLYCSRKCRDRMVKREQRGAGWVPSHKRDDAPQCSLTGCEKARFSLGFCVMHYSRFKKHGTPGEVAARRSPGAWRVTSDGYIRRNVNGKTELQHSVVMTEVLGRDLYPDENVHHKNGDRGDNRIENLELWSSYQPAGQRVTDKLNWAYEIIARYGNLAPMNGEQS
jgi:hypothetical protein